jgi:hypothetical protein
MAEHAPFLPGLSPVGGKPVHVAFDADADSRRARPPPGGEQRIALQVEDLAAIGLGDAQVAELHGGHVNGRLRDRAVRPCGRGGALSYLR